MREKFSLNFNKQRLSFPDRLLESSGWSFLLLGGILFIMNIFDDRMIFERGIWDKPLRFSISGGIFTLTIHITCQWLVAQKIHIPRRHFLMWSFALIFWFEILYILIQSFRERDSHFNRETIIESVLFDAMGIGITTMMLCLCFIGFFALLSYYETRKPMMAAVGLGFILTGILSTYTGILLAGVEKTQSSFPVVGFHIPMFGWRLDGTDMRPAHFIAVHMMQFLPFICWVLGFVLSNKTWNAGIMFLFAVALSMITIWII